MKVAKFTPVVGKVHDEIDRVFDRFFGNRFFGEPLLPPFALEPMVAAWTPVFDMTEVEREYLVKVEVPGIPKENLDINLTGDLLTITGHRELAQEGKGETYLWKERETGKFIRTIRLPAPVMETKIEANFQDGVLTIHLPKMAPTPANKILIK
jgi:HSP20 family protein